MAQRSGRVAYRVDLERGGAEQLPIPATFLASFFEIAPAAVCLAGGPDIVYLRGLGQGRFEVVRRSAETGAETTLHEGGGPASELGLARSPDGSRIAFVDMRDGEARLVVMSSAGGEPIIVASSPQMVLQGRLWHEFSGFMWLPAGNGLLVSRRIRNETAMAPTPEVTLWRVLLDGSPATAVGRMRLPPNDRSFYGSIHYSLHPSGSRIAFEWHAGFVSQVWAIDKLAQFIRSGGSLSAPSARQRR
jgi:hypothetical protein